MFFWPTTHHQPCLSRLMWWILSLQKIHALIWIKGGKYIDNDSYDSDLYKTDLQLVVMRLLLQKTEAFRYVNYKGSVAANTFQLSFLVNGIRICVNSIYSLAHRERKELCKLHGAIKSKALLLLGVYSEFEKTRSDWVEGAVFFHNKETRNPTFAIPEDNRESHVGTDTQSASHLGSLLLVDQPDGLGSWAHLGLTLAETMTPCEGKGEKTALVACASSMPPVRNRTDLFNSHNGSAC